MKGLLVKGSAVAAVVAAVLVPVAMAAKSAPKADLPLVVLPKAQLGSAARHLTIAHDSGALSNDAAENLANITPRPGTFKKLGRVSGYVLDYGSIFAGAPGLNDVQTAVDEYRSPAAAKKGLAFWKKDDARITIIGAFGIKVSDSTFSVPRLGSTRFGNVAALSVPGAPAISLADVRVADGDYLLDARVSAGTAAAAKGLAAKLAQTLELRLGRDLAGRLHARAVKLPAHLKAGPPASGPDLSTLTLQSSDFTGTATVADSGYQIDPPAVSEYALDMQPAGNFDSLSQTIDWYSSPTESTYLGAFLSSSFAGFLAELSGSSSVKPTPVDLTGVGDHAQASMFQLSVGGQSYSFATVYLTRQHVLDFVEAGGQSLLSASQVQSLARSAAARLDAGFPAS